MTIRAHLPLDGEAVEVCRECGTPSTASLSGRDNWVTLRARPGSMLLVEICGECYAQLHPPILTKAPAP